MMQEINKALRGYMAVTLLSGVEERLFCYAETRALHGGVIGERPASLRQDDLPWRNEVYYTMGRMSREQGFPDPCPMHTEYLECVVSRRRRPSRRRRSSSFVAARRRRAAPRRAASRRARLSGARVSPVARAYTRNARRGANRRRGDGLSPATPSPPSPRCWTTDPRLGTANRSWASTRSTAGRCPRPERCSTATRRPRPRRRTRPRTRRRRGRRSRCLETMWHIRAGRLNH